VIYEYADKTPQGCAVQAAFGPLNGRKKRDVHDHDHGFAVAHDDHDSAAAAATKPPTFVEDLLKEYGFKLPPEGTSGGGGGGGGRRRPKRDVRSVQKFIELALIIDQAMVRVKAFKVL